MYDALFSLRKRKKKHLTSLRKWLKGRKQKFDYLPFDVRVNPGRNMNLSVLPDCFLCLGSADMYVAHLCRERELHERVVYQLGRRRLLIMLIFKKLR